MVGMVAYCRVYRICQRINVRICGLRGTMPMEGLKTIQSHFGPDETMSRLEAGIKARGLSVFARINHAMLAEQAGLTLRPTEVIIFVNPGGDTPLMQANQTIRIDLPVQSLVWHDAAGD